MPVDHSQHGFLKDIGTDWVALSANGSPLARAATEEGVRRAMPDAAEYITGKKSKAEKIEAETVVTESTPEPAKTAHQEPTGAVEPAAIQPAPPEPTPADDKPEPTAISAFDHDGDGHDGGSEKGDNATASRSHRQRRPA